MVDAITTLSGVMAGVLLPTAVRRSAPADRLEKPGKPEVTGQDRFEPRSADESTTRADAYDRWGRSVDQGQSVDSAKGSDWQDADTYPPPDPKLAIAANLSDQERQEVDKLKNRDAEVRSHEQAHKAAGGDLAGSISFKFKRGPDGQQYAVGGEVPIDVSPVDGDPQATITKIQRVRRAALAPANPSSQDRSVAAEASRLEQQARLNCPNRTPKPIPTATLQHRATMSCPVP